MEKGLFAMLATKRAGGRRHHKSKAGATKRTNVLQIFLLKSHKKDGSQRWPCIVVDPGIS